MHTSHLQRTAFSLVELSIVLVILGLLVGGVLSGQSLIRAAEMRAVSEEHGRWIAATNSFRDKYFAIPGDMNNATKFWGAADTGGNCALTSTGGKETCNGDGNGSLDGNYSGDIGNEFFRFWQQLANAGMVEGSYTGVRFTVASDGGENSQFDNAQAGVNSPAGKMSGSDWAAVGLAFYPLQTYVTNWVTNYGNNVLIFGASAGFAPASVGILKPEEAWNIDTKMDDGKPGTGTVLSGYDTTCITNAADNTDIGNAAYNLSDGSKACYLIFAKAF